MGRTVATWLAVAVSLAAWALVAALGLRDGFSFLSHTAWHLAARPGSATSVSVGKYAELFPQRVFEYPYSYAILVQNVETTETTENDSARRPTSRPVSHPVAPASRAVAALTQAVVNATVGSCSPGVLCWWRRAEGLYVHGQGPDFDPALYVTPDGKTATLITVSTNHHFHGDDMEAAWVAAERRIARWMSQHALFRDESTFRVSFTHEEKLLREASARLVADFERGDMITLPIAWVMLLLACGPSALVLIVTLPVTFVGVFYALGLAADAKMSDGSGGNRFHFASFTPAIFVNFCIAISLDYVLFMLSSYQSGLRKWPDDHMQAAAAIYLGMRVMNGTDSWNQTMEHYTGYTRAEIEPCVRDMYNVFKASETAKQRAVRRKYTSKTRYAVTSLPEVVNFTM